MPDSADDVLRYVTELGLSSLELRSQPVEAYSGAPSATRVPSPPGPRKPPTEEQLAAQRAAASPLEAWRLSAAIDKFNEFRKKYADPCISIDIVKFYGVDKMKY